LWIRAEPVTLAKNKVRTRSILERGRIPPTQDAIVAGIGNPDDTPLGVHRHSLRSIQLASLNQIRSYRGLPKTNVTDRALRGKIQWHLSRKLPTSYDYQYRSKDQTPRLLHTVQVHVIFFSAQVDVSGRGTEHYFSSYHMALGGSDVQRC
jgi:hypothetical protein